jgi:hypothetical protein
VVIASAVIPTAIATYRFLPLHLLESAETSEVPAVEGGEPDYDDLRDE